jgi:pyrroline-5-carboxylate reductase
MKKVCIVGVGNLGLACIKGLLNSDYKLLPFDINKERLKEIKASFNLNVYSSYDILKEAEFILIALKPEVLIEVKDKIASYSPLSGIIISFAARINLAFLKEAFPGRLVVRAMPNLPIGVRKGVIVISWDDSADEKEKKEVIRLLSILGRIEEIPEKYQDIITVVSGAFPGYAALILEAFIDTAVELGLNRDLAESIIIDSMIGTAHQIREEKIHPAILRNQVTSPGGITAAILHVLEERGLRGIIASALATGLPKGDQKR